MNIMNTLTITIPQKLFKSEELMVIPRKEYEEYLELKETKSGGVTEKNILRWSREAKSLKNVGKLPVLISLKGLK